MFDFHLAQLGVGDWIVNALVAAATAALLVFFARPRVRHSETWRATVTPLASIIGSGFLVVAPLLGFTAGRFAVVAMAGILVLAQLAGSAVRYNIAEVEDISESKDSHSGVDGTLKWMGRAAKLVLAAAYVIAVTFYLEILGAFVLRLFGVENATRQKWIATALVVAIGAFGLWRGLKVLEWMETYAVETKLAIIGGLLVGLAIYNGELLATGDWALPAMQTSFDLTTLRQLLGAFLIVQGFETSRYLRDVYPAKERVATMRYAQWIAAAIYLVFVALATVLLGTFDSVSETGILDLSSQVAFVLPYLLVVGAVMSQLSAAIADTIGSGGLVEEASYGKVDRRLAYAAVAGLALALLWSTNIFAVIAYASRAFAFYYAIQCAMAAVHAWSRDDRKPGRAALFALMTLLMLITAVFGIPAESAGGGG